MKTALLLRKAEAVLTNRLEQLQSRLQAGEEGLWIELCEVVRTLTQLRTALLPEHGGPMLTTAEMAARLGIEAKTLLRHKKNGKIRPTVQQGKHLRWNGQERLQ